MSTWTGPSPPWTTSRPAELYATARALERRRDGVGMFSSIFRNVADARGQSWSTGLSRFHLREYVSRADETVAAQIADAPAPFWRHVREAVEARDALGLVQMGR
jgi:hypothetical protein